MGYETLDTEEFTVNYEDTEVLAKVILREVNRSVEIDVNLYDDWNERYHTKNSFKVTDRDDRVAVFRRTSVEGKSDPESACLRALNRYGFECSNFQAENLDKPARDKIQPTLAYADRMLGAIVKLPDEDSPFGGYPFMKNLVEGATTLAAQANSFMALCEEVGGERVEDSLDIVINQNPELFREWIIASGLSDEFNKYLLPGIFNMSFPDREPLTVEEIEDTDLDDLRPMLAEWVRSGIGDGWRESESPPLERIRELAARADPDDENADVGDIVVQEVESEFSDPAWSAPRVFAMQFIKVRGSSMPWVAVEGASRLPSQQEGRAEVMEEILRRTRAENPEETFAASLADAGAILSERGL